MMFVVIMVMEIVMLMMVGGYNGNGTCDVMTLIVLSMVSMMVMLRYPCL